MDVSQREIGHAAVLEKAVLPRSSRGMVCWAGWRGRRSSPFTDEAAGDGPEDGSLRANSRDAACRAHREGPSLRLQARGDWSSGPGRAEIAPFHYVGVQVRIGVQAEELHRPTQGNANVCRESGFLGKQVALTDLTSGTQVVVRASGSYPCTGYARFPDIQLTPRMRAGSSTGRSWSTRKP